MSLFTEELKDSALLSIGHRAGLEVYHNRKLHLIQTEEGRVLSKKPKRKEKPVKTTTVKDRAKAKLDSVLGTKLADEIAVSGQS